MTLNGKSRNLLNSKSIPKNQLKFIVLGDSHLSIKGYDKVQKRYLLDSSGENYKKILQHIVNNYSNTVSFVVHGGDTIGEGNKEDNFKAFVSVTEGILFHPNVNLPIFVTIGNHDFVKKNGSLSSGLFEKFIGDLTNDIQIPGTNVHLLQLPTFFKSLGGAPYFRSEDLNWLRKKTLQTKPPKFVLIDFHADLRVGKFKNAGSHYVLDEDQTNAFFQSISPNVQAIFNHHSHTSYQFKINEKIGGQKVNIPYLITGCGGNMTSNAGCPNYYVVTMDKINTSNPTVHFKPVNVPGLTKSTKKKNQSKKTKGT
ncbi:metallophosphoesterase family protein [Niallia oryzisoli]|uniref:metallophosphoesterase family protein n=1 Tax=Niallia oryzisoli TaxID=1737571 RepID=UPI003735F11C